MTSALTQQLFFLWLIRSTLEINIGLITGASLSDCALHPDHCWDGYSCFATNDTCKSGRSLYNYGKCADCGQWDDANNDLFCLGFDHFVGDPNYPQLPNGTTFHSSLSATPFGTPPYLVYRMSRSVNWYWYGLVLSRCNLWRAPSVQLNVNCPTGYYPNISTVRCEDNNQNNYELAFSWAVTCGWSNSECCCNCYSYIAGGAETGCQMCAQWDNMPYCMAGCTLPTLPNGTVTVTNAAGGLKNGVYTKTSTISLVCNSGSYLSSSIPIATCTVSGNNVASWTNMSDCLPGCKEITTFANGQVQYSTNPIMGVLYSLTTVATFNCTTGYYLPTLTSTTATDCSAAGNWTSIPQCLLGCKSITTFAHGQPIAYSPTTTVNSLYPQNTTAIFNCSTGYYLSTLTTVNSSICNGNGQWSFVPNCKIGCPDIGSFPNGNYTYITTGTVASLDNSVYWQSTIATFTCNFQYYLSTKTQSTTTDCNSIGGWTSVPTCILGCLKNDTQLQITNGVIDSFTTTLTSPINGYLYQTGDSVNFTCTGSNYLSSVSPAVCSSGQWAGIPSCVAGCVLPTLLNGSVSVSYASGRPQNGVYPTTATINYKCNSGYYLSTLTVAPLSAQCTVSGNVANWTVVPSCLHISAGIGTVSYTPNIPTYSPTGYVPQTVLAVFNCTSGYYLDPPNYTYNCTEPNGIWDLGNSAPVCRIGCPTITTFPNGQLGYSPTTNLITGVHRWTTVATFTCSTGYYLSTLTSSTTTDCNVTGSWTAMPQCLLGCPAITTFTNGQPIFYAPNTVVNSLYTQGTTTIFNCSAGYYLSTLTTVNSSVCLGTGQWSFVPNCTIGCPPILSLANGNPIVYTPISTTDNDVYRQNSFATFTCHNDYYLSTLTTSNSTDCNENGIWSNIPTCLAACASLTFGSGTISYSPNIPAYMSTGYVPQSTLAIFNCSSGFYLDPANYVYNCTGPNWDLGPSVPVCKAGCLLPTLPNGTVTIIDSSSLRNGVCPAATIISYACNAGYYLSTFNVAPLNATCTVSGNSGSWTAIPTCIPGCQQLTMATGTGTVSYVPNLPNYSPTGYVPQTTLAVLNCTIGYYLDPPNYTYNCTGPNGIWDLGNSAPVCKATPQAACTAAPNITNMNTLTYTVEMADRKLNTNTTVAHYTCQTSFQMVGSGIIKCVNGNWTSSPPECNAIPLVVTVTKAVMTLSCSFLVIALGIIIVVTLLIRDFTIETCLHLNEEFALFFAHLLLLLFRDRVDLTNVCPAASAGIQYFFTTAFICMMIEAIHSHAILQNVISFGGIFDCRPRLKYFIVGFLVPIIYTGITAAMRYNKYQSEYSCYVNLGDQIALFIMGPITVSFFLTIILTEAAAMGDWKSLPLASKQQRLAAHFNQKAMAPLVSLSLGSWFCSLLASYLNSPYIFTIGSGINMAFGVSIVVFHFIGNPKLNKWFHQNVLKNLCNEKTRPLHNQNS